MNDARSRWSAPPLLTWWALLLGVVLVVILVTRDGDESDPSASRAEAEEGVIQQWEPEERVAVDDFDGELLDGTHFRLGHVAGEVAVFNLWGSWCAPCRVEAPDLREVALEYGGRGVTFVGLNVRDNGAAAQAFERKFRIPYASIRSQDSGRVALAFGGQMTTNAVPTTVVVDREGRLAARVLGVVSAPTLGALLDDVLAEPVVDSGDVDRSG